MNSLSFPEFVTRLTVTVLPLVLSITLRHMARAWAAWKLGDTTGKARGLLTLNPTAYIDPFGTLVFPLLSMMMGGAGLFGWGRDVPVDIRNLRHPRRDIVLIALAGPGCSLLLALLAAGMFHLLPFMPHIVVSWVAQNLETALWVNALLIVFNLLPIPPLDGGIVLVGLLPPRPAHALARLEPQGWLIITGLFFLLPLLLQALGLGALSPARWLLSLPAGLLVEAIAHLTGLVS